MDLAFEAAARQAAFDFIKARGVEREGTWEIDRAVLARGFPFGGRLVPLLGPQGIFKPAILDAALSLTTVPPIPGRLPPYADAWDESGLLIYRYRGTDPAHRDNEWMRLAMRHQLPIVYFEGLEPGRYAANFPAFIVADDPKTLSVRVAFDEERIFRSAGGDPIARRQYISRLTKQRLHQAAFRRRVLIAYRTTCTMCRLRHEELLDAAHILPDADPRAEPIVSSGLALCKLHHAAYDADLVGLRPDHVIEVRRDVLKEEDGPTLRYGLQGLHGHAIVLPRRPDDRPNPVFLEERYERFRRAV